MDLLTGLLVIAVLTHGVGDIVTTWYALHHANGAAEQNPLGKLIFDKCGIDAGILVCAAIKILLFVGLAWTLRHIYYSSEWWCKPFAVLAAAIVAIVGVLIVANNTSVIMGGGANVVTDTYNKLWTCLGGIL